MSATLHERLVQRAVAGKYDLFLGVGGGCTVLGLILFIHALGTVQADRAWQLFHVNWLYFTGLAGGSVAFVAVATARANSARSRAGVPVKARYRGDRQTWCQRSAIVRPSRGCNCIGAISAAGSSTKRRSAIRGCGTMSRGVRRTVSP